MVVVEEMVTAVELAGPVTSARSFSVASASLNDFSPLSSFAL